ncbi:helix-turn-helix domain-containing protein [Neomicrococcus aestuarii]|uniref:DNA-binding protein n=1 Tax=Neomicrococcus aestuarii TaxID=556325 RepID=A0A1L2ZPL3_9MICC|nr:helix-turn-helix domain-containing protein [Neomicrococcus aestuarii]APF41120.1 DNA-binding protein [Neomicrococcus aestuarii]
MSEKSHANQPATFAPLNAAAADRLAKALADSDDVTVFVDGTAVKLPAEAVVAVQDVLRRLSRGDSITVSTNEEFLNTSEAAKLAGISHTYMRQLTDKGEIPVEYRGTHRRIKPADVMAWLASRSHLSDKGK